jgi:hypothetical protein
MNPDDIDELDLTVGAEVLIGHNGTGARATLVAGDIARGAVFVPYDQKGMRANTLMSELNPTVEVKPA